MQGLGGNDWLEGGAGDDLLIGGDSAFDLSDQIFGGNGNDTIYGGPGADRFYHLGITDHGSDWIQDYSAAEGDVLVFGGSASITDFQINFAETPNAGSPSVAEAFIIDKRSGHILWALVDGGAQEQIILSLGGSDYDLLA